MTSWREKKNGAAHRLRLGALGAPGTAGPRMGFLRVAWACLACLACLSWRVHLCLFLSCMCARVLVRTRAAAADDDDDVPLVSTTTTTTTAAAATTTTTTTHAQLQSDRRSQFACLYPRTHHLSSPNRLRRAQFNNSIREPVLPFLGPGFNPRHGLFSSPEPRVASLKKF